MKTIILSGSRNPDGQTARAANALLQGFVGQGEQIFLPQLNIERCRQCDERGWGICRTEGKCVIEDDFASLVGKIREAAAVIFATPVSLAIGAGFVPLRKPGKLPYETISVSYALEYGEATIEVHKDAIKKGERVLILDDLLATAREYTDDLLDGRVNHVVYSSK